MSIFNKTRYLRTLFVLLPSGIILIYFGIKGLSTSVSDLPYSKGTVDRFYFAQKHFDNCDCDMRTFFIHLSEIKKPYITCITVYCDTLDNVIKEGDSMEVWVKNDNNLNQIQQVKLNGVMVVEYDRLIGFKSIITLIGIGLTALCVFYLLKSPEDLHGGTEEEKKAERKQEEKRKNRPKIDTSKYDKYMGI